MNSQDECNSNRKIPASEELKRIGVGLCAEEIRHPNFATRWSSEFSSHSNSNSNKSRDFEVDLIKCARVQYVCIRK